jgi:hypothetical protein
MLSVKAKLIMYLENLEFFSDQTEVGTLYVHIDIQNRSVNKLYHQVTREEVEEMC